MFFSGLRHIRTGLLSLAGVKYPHYCTCVFFSSFKAKQDGLSFGLSGLRSTFCTEMKMWAQRLPCFSSEDSCFICISTPIFALLLSERSSTPGLRSDSRQPGRASAVLPGHKSTSAQRSQSVQRCPLIHLLLIHPRFVLAYVLFWFFCFFLPSKGGSTARLKWSVIRWDKNVPSRHEAGLCWCALWLTIALLKFYCWCVFVLCSRGHVAAETTV